MKNFVLGAVLGSAVTGYLTGHIKVTNQGIAFVPPVKSSPATPPETSSTEPPSPPDPNPPMSTPESQP